MSIIGKIKIISSSTLELLREDPLLVAAFFDAQWWSESGEKINQEAKARFVNLPSPQDLGWLIPASPLQWENSYDWQALEEQFLAEWETAELDLHKYWPEITFLLAGYVPGYVTSEWTVPELNVDNKYEKEFLPFLLIENSAWDGLPLVNAFGAGAELAYSRDYGAVRYLVSSEVEQIFDGLLKLSPKGYRKRFIRESKKPGPLPWIDWSEEEMLYWMTDYYREIVAYYRNAVSQHKTLLLYLT